MTHIENSTVKGEYDNTYPPLNMPSSINSRSGQQKNALHTAISQSQDPKDLIIASTQKRFQDQNAPLMMEMLKNVAIQYKVKTKIIISQLGNLVVRMDGAPHQIEKAKFLLRESLTVQKTIRIDIPEKNLRHFMDRKVHAKLCENRYLTVRLTGPPKAMVLEGGQASVDAANREVEEYLSWHDNTVKSVLEITKVFHNFINGHGNSNIKHIIEKSGNYVDVKFDSTDAGCIILTGNKISVEMAREKIQRQYEVLNHDLVKKSFDVTQIQCDEILRALGNNLFDQHNVSHSATLLQNGLYHVDLLGKANLIGKYIEEVISITRSFSHFKLNTPYWVCMIFKTSEDCLNVLKSAYPKAQFIIHPLDENIEVVCDHGFVDEISRKLANCVEDLTINNNCDTLIIPDDMGRLLIGREHQKVASIQSTTDTAIFFEQPSDGLNLMNRHVEFGFVLCSIVGEPSLVLKSKSLMEQHIKFLSSFKTLKLDAPNHLHRYIIGAKGKKLNELISNHGLNCTVSFGKPLAEADQCLIKGPESELKSLEQAIKDNLQELSIYHYKEIWNVTEQFSSFMKRDNFNFLSFVQKSCALENLQVICNEKRKDTVDSLVLTGHRDNVKKALQNISQKAQELSTMISHDVVIPDSLIEVLTTFGDSLLDAISNDVGSDIRWTLPEKISSKAKINLFGPAQQIKEIMGIVKKLGNSEYGNYYYEKMKVSRKYIDDIKQSKGVPLFKILGSSKVRIYLPFKDASLPLDVILLLGKKEDVQNIKSSIVLEVKILENTIEKTINIKASYKREFLRLRNNMPSQLSKISQSNGGIKISIGDNTSTADMVPVVIKGQKEHMEPTCKAIQDYTKKLDERVAITVNIIIKDLAFVFRRIKSVIKNMVTEYDVSVSISQEYFDTINSANPNYDKECSITLSGSPKNVEECVNIINSWKVVEKTISYSQRKQKSVFGYETEHYADLSDIYHAELFLGCTKLPPEDTIIISALAKDIDRTYDYIMNACSENYSHQISIQNKYFLRLIGKKGANIKKFNTENNVRVFFPPTDGVVSDIVTINGKKDDCLAAADKIYKTVARWEATITTNLEFDARARSALLGHENFEIRKFNQEYDVLIRLASLPDRKSSHTDRKRTLEITGLSEDVERCCNFIKERLEYIMEDLEEQTRYERPSDITYQVDVSAISGYKYVTKGKNPSKISTNGSTTNNEVATIQFNSVNLEAAINEETNATTFTQ